MAKARASLKDRLHRDGFFQTSADLPRIVEIDVGAIRPNPAQPRRRFDQAALDDLASSIERHGLLQPIVVAKDGAKNGESWTLIAGERRLRALRGLGRASVPAIVSDGDPVELAIIENLQREALDPFEEARAIRALMQSKGYTQAEVGRAIGKKQNTVSVILALNDLPERVRDEYPTSDKRFGRSWLIELARVETPERQLRLWDEAKAKPVTVRELRAARAGKKPRAAKPATLRALAAARTCARAIGGLEASDVAHDGALRAALRNLKAALERRLDGS